MAKVNQAHRTKRIWPYIAGFFSLVAIIWIAVSFLSSGDENIDISGEGIDFESVPADVNAFSDFIIIAKDSVGEGINSEYAKAGISSLASALSALVQSNSNSSEDLLKLNYKLSKKAESISNEQDFEDLDELKEALVQATEVIDSLTTNKNNLSNEVLEIHSITNQINEDAELQNQDTLVMNYFTHANEIIKAIANPESTVEKTRGNDD